MIPITAGFTSKDIKGGTANILLWSTRVSTPHIYISPFFLSYLLFPCFPPLYSSLPSHPLLNVLFFLSRVYEKMMERLQEIGSSISGVKRVISTWAKKKGLKGNENRQKK